MDEHPSTDPGQAAEPDRPQHRPLERFWPYVDLPEQPTDEEVAALDPALAAALFGTPPGPFSLTFVFPAFEGAGFAHALELARASTEYREIGQGDQRRHHARFGSAQVRDIRALWDVIGHLDESEVLLDGQPVPYARELWLPLLWLLIR